VIVELEEAVDDPRRSRLGDFLQRGVFRSSPEYSIGRIFQAKDWHLRAFA